MARGPALLLFIKWSSTPSRSSSFSAMASKRELGQPLRSLPPRLRRAATANARPSPRPTSYDCATARGLSRDLQPLKQLSAKSTNSRRPSTPVMRLWPGRCGRFSHRSYSQSVACICAVAMAVAASRLSPRARWPVSVRAWYGGQAFSEDRCTGDVPLQEPARSNPVADSRRQGWWPRHKVIGRSNVLERQGFLWYIVV